MVVLYNHKKKLSYFWRPDLENQESLCLNAFIYQTSFQKSQKKVVQVCLHMLGVWGLEAYPLGEVRCSEALLGSFRDPRPRNRVSVCAWQFESNPACFLLTLLVIDFV